MANIDPDLDRCSKIRGLWDYGRALVGRLQSLTRCYLEDDTGVEMHISKFPRKAATINRRIALLVDS